MGFFRYVFNNAEGDLCNEYQAALPSIEKIIQQGKAEALMAAFVVSLFGFKNIYEDLSPEGELKYTAAVRKKAIEGLHENLFDSTVNWLTGAFISHLDSSHSLTIRTLAPLHANFFLPAFQAFESGEISPYLVPEFANLTREQRGNALRSLGKWNLL